MRRTTRAITALLLLSYAALGWGYPWDQDMVDQPSAKPQESPAPAEPNAIPIGGGETMPDPTRSTTPKAIYPDCLMVLTSLLHAS